MFQTLRTLTGKIDIPLSDDVLMHYVMTKSNRALKGLVCALKGLRPEDIDSAVLTNPIDYGSYAQKEIILDIKVLMGSGEILDIELQLYHDAYWIERSLYYLSRAYDTLASGEKYQKLKPVTHISIIRHDLFPDHPEFYSRFLLKNLRYDYPYTSIFALNVLYLNRIDLATESDWQSDLVYWAKLFNATTWEELNALARPDAFYEEVYDLMVNVNIQPEERTYFEAHRRYVMERNTILSDLEDAKAELNSINDQLNSANKQLSNANEQLNNANDMIAEYRRLYGDLPGHTVTTVNP